MLFFSLHQPAVHVQGQEPLTASMLAAAPPQEQKQMLGECSNSQCRQYIGQCECVNAPLLLGALLRECLSLTRLFFLLLLQVNVCSL